MECAKSDGMWKIVEQEDIWIVLALPSDIRCTHLAEYRHIGGVLAFCIGLRFAVSARGGKDRLEEGSWYKV